MQVGAGRFALGSTYATHSPLNLSSHLSTPCSPLCPLSPSDGQPADARLAGGGGCADPDPSLEPAEIPRNVVGGDGVSAGGRAAANAAAAVRAMAAAGGPHAAGRAGGAGRGRAVHRAGGLRLRARRTRPPRAGPRRLLLDGLQAGRQDAIRAGEGDWPGRSSRKARRATPSRWC